MVVLGWLSGRGAVLGCLGGWRAELWAQKTEVPLCRTPGAGADMNKMQQAWAVVGEMKWKRWHAFLCHLGKKHIKKKMGVGDFPGGPVAKTPRSQCRGPRYNPWSGN